MPHSESTETFYKQSQIVCVKADFRDTRKLFMLACLQEYKSVGMKRVKANVSIQDLFNPVLFTKDAERYVDVSNIDFHHTNEVVTVAEAAETAEMAETATSEIGHKRISRRGKRRFESDFFYYEYKGKTSKQI